MVPTLSINRDSLKDNEFINAYINDGKRDVQYENCYLSLIPPKKLG